MCIISVVAIVVNVILTLGEHGLSLQEWNTVKQNTKNIFAREYPRGIIVINFVSPILTTSSTTYTLTNKEEAYYNWRDRLKAEKKKGIWLVVLPPVEDNGHRYIAGYARTTCFKDINLASIIVFLQNENERGEDRRMESSYVIAHELGHQFSASHVTSQTIMNPNPLPWVTQYGSLPFDIKSKREMRRCVS